MSLKSVADTIFYSSNIYTVTCGMVSGGVAVKDGVILAVGSREEASLCAGDNTLEIDFGDKLLMPGFIDGHTHMMPFGLKADLSSAVSIEECVRLIESFVSNHHDLSFVVAHKWYAANWGGKLPTRLDIDKVVSNVPFLAVDLDIHLLWCNTKLLEIEGYIVRDVDDSLKASIPDNKSLMVDIDEQGMPTGILRDEACMEVYIKYQPGVSEDTVRGMFDVFTQYGVTAINDMDFYKADEEIYQTVKMLEKKDELNVRVFASIDANYATDEAIEYAKSYMNTDMLRLNSLKAFMDGTGSGRTAYMKRPYKGTDEYGVSYLAIEKLLDFLEQASKHSLAMHTHCCGDRAVFEALTAYEEAQSRGVHFDERFSIEHCDTTDEVDLERPAKLGISLNLTPDFLAPTYRWENNPYIDVYDDETKKRLWRLKSFLSTGVNVSFGTDYTASSMNPFDQIYRAIYRKADDGNPSNGYRMEEALTLEEALYCYTMGSARSVGMEKKLGSVETGKYADMMVIDTNLFEAESHDIKKAKVIATILNGKMVYTRR